MKNKTDVEKIIDYLQGKISNLKSKQEKYENPIMQDLMKNNQALQMEYLRLQARIDEIEDNLLAIQKFTHEVKPPEHDSKRKGPKEKN